MDLLWKIKLVWQKISLVQRALLIAVSLTFVIVGGLVVHWARQPEMRLLYQDLSPEEASRITEKISEKGVVYQLRNGGTTILVPTEKVYQLRLDMAKEGLPSGEQNGYRIFDKEKIAVSPFVQNINLKRALQEELAKSIQMIEGVVHARVHIVTSEQTFLGSQAGKTSASVVLQLRPGYRLSGLNVAAIAHLVSSSIEGLKPENVTVIDSQGQLLSNEAKDGAAGGARTVQDYRERVEQNLADKVEEMLNTVLGPGRATVKVSAVIDMNSTNVVTERFEPKGVAVKEEIKERSKTEPGGTAAEGAQAAAGGAERDSTTVSEFAFGKTIETRVELPGKIKTLSVAALVDLTAPDSNATGAAGQTPKTIMELSDVEQIIRNALGLRETDSLKVVQAKFYRPVQPLIEEEPSQWPMYITIARHASLGIMAICALLVLRVLGGARKKAVAAGGAARLAAGESAGLLPAGVEGSEPLGLRRQIAGALRSNPDQVRELFSKWLEEREE